MDLEKLENEFKGESRAVREDIYKLITYIAVHCQECKELQNKKYHSPDSSKELERHPWEIGNSEKVTDKISTLLSGNIKGGLRKVVEQYKNYHVHSKCEEAEKLITEVYEKLTKIKDDTQNGMRCGVI